MRALKITGAAVAAIVVILALVMIVGIPSGFLTSTIKERVERETGYRLTIAGSTKISLWPTLNVTHERPDAAGAEGSRRRQQGHDRHAAGRHDAVERLVGPSGDLRAHRHQAGAVCAAAARAPSRRRATAPTSPRRASARRRADRSHHRSSTARSHSPIRATGWRAASTPSMPRRPSTPIARSSSPGTARSGATPMKFDIKATVPAPPVERQNIPVELTLDAPGALNAPLVGQGRGAAQRPGGADQRRSPARSTTAASTAGPRSTSPASRW